MKKIKLFEEFVNENLNEANKGKVHKAAKQGSYPAVVVVVQDGKVIHQESVSTPEVAPATFNVMQEKYPKALIHLEDKTGKRLFTESVVYNSSNTKPEAAKQATKEFGKLLPKANKGVEPYVFAVIKTKARNYRLAIKSGSYVAHEFMSGLQQDGILTSDIVKKAVANVIKLNPEEFNESVVTEAKNTTGLAFKEEQDYLDFVEFCKDEGVKIRKDLGEDKKTKSWSVEMDIKELEELYGEIKPGNKNSGWLSIKDDFDSVIIESVVTEAYDGNMLDFKYEFPTKFEEVSGNSSKAIKKISKKGKGYEVRTSTHMSQAEMEKVGLALGLELKSYTKDSRISISIYESVVNEGKGFKNTVDFEKFLIEIDGMGDYDIKKIMGKDHIDTPGFYQDEKKDYDGVLDFMRSNMGQKEFDKLESWWENNVAESVVNEKREEVGKYNTVKKVIAKVGRRPSVRFLADFIMNNYYDVTEVEKGEDDATANDKIADLVGFFKYDTEEWEEAWEDREDANESVVNEDSAGIMMMLKTGTYKDTRGKKHTLKKGQRGRHERVGWDGDFVHFGNLVFDASTFDRNDIEVDESVVTEAKFVKDFNKEVLDVTTKEEVLKLYPGAEFFIGKSTHFFGELDTNLFFKAYYTKKQEDFKITTVYSKKGSNYVNLYTESVNTTESTTVVTESLTVPAMAAMLLGLGIAAKIGFMSDEKYTEMIGSIKPTAKAIIKTIPIIGDKIRNKELKDYQTTEVEKYLKNEITDKDIVEILKENPKLKKAIEDVSLNGSNYKEYYKLIKEIGGVADKWGNSHRKFKSLRKKLSDGKVLESVVNEGKFDNIANLTKALHFETDEKTAEEMKMELGKKQGEVSKRKQIEIAEYSLRRFRKSINFGDGTYLGVFLPGSYDASTSTLGDGPHKKAVKKIRWTQRKYDQWLEDMASNGGAENAFDMAQNAKNEPGLIDWVKKEFRGDDALQRIQWDIEGFAESVVTESEYQGMMSGDVAEYIAKELSHYVKQIVKQPNDSVTYFQVKGKSSINKTIQALIDLYGIEAQSGGNSFSPSITIKFDNDQMVSESLVTEAKKTKEDYQDEINKINDYNDKIIKKKSNSKSERERSNLTKLINNNDSALNKLFNKLRDLSESAVTEEKIKYIKGKGTTYQSSGHWTVQVDSNSSMCDISVNSQAGWRLDPHDDREETWQLLDGGRQRATIYFRSGNIDKFAKQMFDLNDKTTWGNKTALTAKDYGDIIRVWIDMRKANESVVTEAKDNLYLQLHKKYAESIKGLKAKKIKKLTDLVSVQRWSMEDREDYFDMDPKKKKELSAEYKNERKLFKQYLGRDYDVMLPKGTEALAESFKKFKDHIASINDGAGSTAEIYFTKGKGYYVVVGGESDYDFDAKDKTELMKKLKDNEFTNDPFEGSI